MATILSLNEAVKQFVRDLEARTAAAHGQAAGAV
ncbi:CoA-transferase subunit beta [Pseudomonas sp. S36]|nr:CoA-transferase subunit beta [Pseudomonas sp. S36]